MRSVVLFSAISIAGCSPSSGATPSPPCSPPCAVAPSASSVQRTPAAGPNGEDAPPPGGEYEHLQQMKSAIVGTWRGVMTNPWRPPSEVEITFQGDLHYSAHCLEPPGCLVFYYGNVEESPAQTYDLVDVLANRKAVGTLHPFARPGGPPMQLKNVTFYNGASRLTFEAWRERYGPMTYDLKRVSR